LNLKIARAGGPGGTVTEGVHYLGCDRDGTVKVSEQLEP
jgi:hypothetical protein